MGNDNSIGVTILEQANDDTGITVGAGDRGGGNKDFHITGRYLAQALGQFNFKRFGIGV